MPAAQGGVLRVSNRTHRKVVQLEHSPREEPVVSALPDHPLYGVAMLKIAMELKKPGAKGLDEILQGVLARMQLPEEAFRRYLSQNGGLLRTIAQRKQF